MTTHCYICNNPIEQARVELNLLTCYSCALKHIKQVRGDMIYSHKTAPELHVMSNEEHKSYRRYVPYGKNTGRGSGTHAMSRPVTSLK